MPVTSSPAMAVFEQRWALTYSHRSVTISGTTRAAEDVAAELLASDTKRPVRDAILLQLIAAGQAGDSAAVHTVLRFLRPTIAGNARLLMANSRGVTRTDALQYSMASAWEAVRAYPHERWVSSVAMNLRQQSRKILATDFASTHQEETVEDATLEQLVEQSAPTGPRSIDDNLATVLLWARDNEVVTADEARQLMAYGLDDDQVHDLLEEYGISRQTLKKRNQRTIKRMRDAIAARITEYGHLELD